MDICATKFCREHLRSVSARNIRPTAVQGSGSGTAAATARVGMGRECLRQLAADRAGLRSSEEPAGASVPAPARALSEPAPRGYLQGASTASALAISAVTSCLPSAASAAMFPGEASSMAGLTAPSSMSHRTSCGAAHAARWWRTLPCKS